jgi:DNA-binding response OmpR family regulator
MKPGVTKILVVEDEALLLFSIAEDLRDAGFDVCEARNADEAIEALKSDSDINVLFTDIDMPGSMDGLKLSAVVRERWPPVKIVVTSGKSEPSADALPSGGKFLPKPYHAQSVMQTVRALFD